MKKLLSSILLAACVALGFKAQASAAGLETPATYYIMPEGATTYVSVGQGTISSAVTSKDKTTVERLVNKIPDLSKYVNAYQTVEWTVISKSSSGKYSVKGTVKAAELSDESLLAAGEKEDTTTEASFKIMLENASGYVSVGQGYIESPNATKNAETATKMVVEIPNLSSYIDGNHIVEWTEISKSSSGKYTVKGTVKTVENAENDEEVTEPVKEEVIEAPIDKQPVADDIYSVLKNMLYTGDASVRDISGFKLTVNQVYEAYYKLIYGEGSLYYAATNGQTYLSNLGLKNGYCTTVQLAGMDANFLSRYSQLVSKVNAVKAKMAPEMSDIEKVLIAHDYLSETVTYNATTALCATASGALVEKKAKCSGITAAFETIMKEVGIKTYTISSKEMNHAWCYVEIDGSVYHIDCTWDNLDYNKGKVYRRNYLLASDDRFAQAIPSKHYSWSLKTLSGKETPNATATSKKYDNWFVHDVTTKMVYENGLWYYGMGGKIMRSDIEGKNQSVVLTESSDVCIISLSQGILKYSVNGVTKSVSVK